MKLWVRFCWNTLKNLWFSTSSRAIILRPRNQGANLGRSRASISTAIFWLKDWMPLLVSRNNSQIYYSSSNRIMTIIIIISWKMWQRRNLTFKRVSLYLIIIIILKETRNKFSQKKRKRNKNRKICKKVDYLSRVFLVFRASFPIYNFLRITIIRSYLSS